MNTKVQVLKDYLAYVIEHEDDYSWGDPSVCNCGMLLKSTNLYIFKVVKQAEILSDTLTLDATGYNYYKDIFNMYKVPICEVTNLPFTKVVDELINKGFTLDELIKLEHLADIRFNENVPKYYYAEYLIQYLNNWISYEEQVSVKQTNKSAVTVGV